jgi:hypothetical protein
MNSNMGHAALPIDTGIIGATVPQQGSFPKRIKKRAGNAVKRVIAS